MKFLALTGGWVGYFSYDTVRYVEKKKLPFASAPPDDRNLADIHLGLYDEVIVFDHVEKVYSVINVLLNMERLLNACNKLSVLVKHRARHA